MNSARKWLAKAHLAPKLILNLWIVLAVSVNLIAPVLAWQWAQRPFLGVLLEQTMVVHSPRQSGQPAELSHPNRILAVNGQPVPDAAALSHVLAEAGVGSSVIVDVETQDGAGGWRTRQITVPLTSFPLANFFSFFGVSYAIALVYLALGLVVYRWRGDTRAGRSFAFFCASSAMVAGLLFDLTTTHALVRVWALAAPLTAAAFIHLMTVFPGEKTTGRYHLPFTVLLYFFALVLAAFGEYYLLDANNPRAYFVPWRWTFTLALVGICAFLLRLIYLCYRARDKRIRQQAGIVLGGSLIAFIPISYWLTSATFQGRVHFLAVLYISSTIFFPLSVAYAILRYRFMGIDIVVRRSLIYMPLALGVVTLFLAAAYLISFQLFHAVSRWYNLLLATAFASAGVLLFDPVRDRAQRLVDRYVYGERYDYRQAIRDFSATLAAIVDLPDLLEALTHRPVALMRIEQATVVLFDPESGNFCPRQGTPSPPPAVCFQGSDHFVQWLRDEKTAIYLARREHRRLLKVLPPQERARLDTLAAVLFVPLRHERQLLGWLALGPKVSGAVYTGEDISLLASLANQAAVAVENARLHHESRQRLAELTALQKSLRHAFRQVGEALATGFNLEKTLGVITDLVVELMAVDVCYVQLVDDEKTQKFTIRDEGGSPQPPERLLAVGKELTNWVARQGRMLKLNDRRSAPPAILPCVETAEEEPLAYLGTPLTLHEETIGVLAVWMKREYEWSRTEEELLASFARQAAVAIEKSWLYEEAEQRYLELRALHDISLDITAQMEMPELLRTILERACTLLGGTGGVVVRLDPERELFRVLAGHGTAADYTGVVFGLDMGIASHVLHTEAPLIVSDVQQWFAERGVPLDTNVKSVIAVPLRWKERIIGVLDVIDDSERRVFDQRDLRLLEAFADQAAIAMKNAELYAHAVEAEEKQRAILASSSDVIATIDLNGNLTSISPAVEEITGYTVDEWLADISWPGLIHPDDLPMLQAELERMLTEQTNKDSLSLRIQRKDGRYVWVQVKSNILRDATGQEMGAVAVIRDITAEKKAQEEIARRNQELAILNEVSSIVSRSLDLDAILTDALDKVWEVAIPESELEDAAGCILLATGDYLIIGAQRQLSAELSQKLMNIESGQPVLHSLTDEDVERLAALSETSEVVRAVFSDEGFQSFVVAPLLSKNQGWGLLAIASRREQFFSPQSVNLITAAGNQIGMAIANAQLFNEVVQERKKLEHVLQSVADGVYTTDRHLRITSFNQAAERLTGIKASQAVGRLCHEVMPVVSTAERLLCGEQSCIVRQAMRQRRSVLSNLNERFLSDKDGRVIPVISVAAPLFDEAGNVDGCVVAFWDVSKKAEMERLKKEFVSMVSHELRTPLTTIGMAAERSLRGDGSISDDEQKEMWLIVHEQSIRLHKFVEQILDVAQLDAGQVPVNLVPVAVDSLVEQLVRKCDREHPTRPVEVRISDDARRVWADKTHLWVILDNFVDNALKYSPDGSPIRIEAHRTDDGMTAISVIDQGIGIPDHDLSRVFDKFYRCDGSDARTVYGYGLGLYIVKMLAEMQGGRVWAESELGAGSRFSVALPAADQSGDRRSDSPTARARGLLLAAIGGEQLIERG